MIPTWIEKSATDEQFIGEVTRWMKQKHFGQENAATMETLMIELFGITKQDDKYDNANRQLRRALEVIKQAHGIPLISDTEKGHWYASGAKEDQDAIDKKKARAKTIFQNANIEEANLYNTYGGQQSLF